MLKVKFITCAFCCTILKNNFVWCENQISMQTYLIFHENRLLHTVTLYPLQQPWPRTQTEKLLGDMFEGSAAQMLSILEAVNDSNRRTLLTAPPAQEQEVEVLDVFAEMFLAVLEIMQGRCLTERNKSIVWAFKYSFK